MSKYLVPFGLFHFDCQFKSAVFEVVLNQFGKQDSAIIFGSKKNSKMLNSPKLIILVHLSDLKQTITKNIRKPSKIVVCQLRSPRTCQSRQKRKANLERTINLFRNVDKVNKKLKKAIFS